MSKKPTLHIEKESVSIVLTFSSQRFTAFIKYLKNHATFFLILLLSGISIAFFIYYYLNQLGLAYNDARSHLDIGRRVVEGLTPGFSQLGSVWLPLPHLLMVPTVWMDFFWHTGLSGALQSMIGFVTTGLLIYLFLKNLGISMFGRLVGVFVFTANLNILYLQSTAMTELLLLATMTAGVYALLQWEKKDTMTYLVTAAFFVMLSTLVRYDGWFLLVTALGIVGLVSYLKKDIKTAEGSVFFFGTLAGFGIILWLLWNLAIFKDPLYFAFGPYSAHSQQEQLEAAGNLATKGNFWYSNLIYLFAVAYNSNAFVLFLGAVGAIVLALDKKIKLTTKLVLSLLLAPLVFNIIALFLGHSVLYIAGLSGNTWFNVRYGIMLMPSLAVFIGYLAGKFPLWRPIIVGLLVFVTYFTFSSSDAVTIDDATIGASQKNVTEVSGWLKENAKDEPGFILISAASHDAIIFSSSLPMKRFIHEGTGKYWERATESPDKWARWIIMRTNDQYDQTFRHLRDEPELSRYTLVEQYPFADIYELKDQYLTDLNYEPILEQ